MESSFHFKDNSWGFPKPKKVYREKMIKELDQISQEKFGMAYKELGYAQGIVIDELLMKNYPLGSTLLFLSPSHRPLSV